MGMDLIPKCTAGASTRANNSVAVESMVLQNSGVRTERVQRRDLARVVRAAGRIDYDERLVSHVHTKVQGWVENLYVHYTGQMVKRGQPLLEIYSPELVSTQEELLIAVRYQEETSHSSSADVKDAGASLLDAAKQRLALWDIPSRDIERRNVVNAVVGSKISVDEEEVQALYREKFANQPQGGTTVHVRQLLVTYGGESRRDQASACAREVPDQLAAMRAALAGDAPPAIDIGRHCKTPYECEFLEYCRRDEPEWSIDELPRLRADRARGRRLLRRRD